MTRTADELYIAAIKRCRDVSMSEGDHSFEVSAQELMSLQSVPFRSAIYTAIDRESITGRPRSFCGLTLVIK